MTSKAMSLVLRKLMGSRVGALSLSPTLCSATTKVQHSQWRGLSNEAGPEQATQTPKTAILMLNMGGPSHPNDTGPFLNRLFSDGDIIELGGGAFQKLLAKFITSRRTPKVQDQYEQIGGSPIKKWTQLQGEKMCEILDAERPESAPHKAYTAFRYAEPLTDDALQEMEKDGVERVVAFSQYPQWSCTTTGSSMNELWRQIKERKLEDRFSWSIIDRWNLQEGFIQAVTERILEGLQKFEEQDRSKVIILFSAHSVPMKVVEKGDHYVPEVAATVKSVMQRLESNELIKSQGVPRHILAWQSKVGYLPWMVPSTSKVIEGLGEKNHKHVLVVPVAFTSDHIETLFEIGIEYAEEAKEIGISHFHMTEGLNGSPTFIRAQADIVKDHLDSGKNYSNQYKMKCIGCTKPLCRQIVNPAFSSDRTK
eukprot:m.183628 g.183628  ORF g.183628 m.183628 type:complete len:423 (-) comp15548_c0_seq1:4409-5677(-)